MEEGSGEKTERENSHQDALGTPTHPVSGPHNRKGCFHNTVMAASARSAVPGWSVPSLLHSETTERITNGGRGHNMKEPCTHKSFY